MNHRRSYFALLFFPASLFFPAARAARGCGCSTPAAKKQLKQRYDFDLTDQWLEHLRLSSVRFQRRLGFVRLGRRLVMTNHHVGCLPCTS